MQPRGPANGGDRIKELFAAALDYDFGDRLQFLREACGADEELLTEVRVLLDAFEEESALIDAPVFDFAAFVAECERAARAEPTRETDQSDADSNGVEAEQPVAVLPRLLGCDDVLKVLGALARDGLVRDDRERVEEHLEHCDSCRGRLRELTADLFPRIDDYTIVERIAEGGFGVVYKAIHHAKERIEALKVLHTQTSLRTEYFENEVHSAARLGHPNIATLYDAQLSAPLPYYTMELVRGQPLSEYVRRRRPALRDLLRLFREICEAVQYAHQRAVIHRDLKPSNIIIDTEGNPKVLDFGLARIAGAQQAIRTNFAETGNIMGTLAYMSPEQTRGGPNEVDTRTDVYALGVILYELLTDRLPYDLTDTEHAEALRLIRDAVPPKPSTIRRGLRGDLDIITLKALEKDPARRYQSAAELRDDIDRYLARQPIHARRRTAVYVLRRLMEREKVASALVIGLFVSVMAFGVWMTALYADRKVWRARAEQADLLLLLLTLLNPSTAHPYFPQTLGITPPEVLDKVGEYAETALGEHPKLEADIRDALGLTYASLGLYDSAEYHLRKALGIRQGLYGHEHVEVAESLEHVSYYLSLYRWWDNPHRDPDEYGEALDNCRAALAIYREVLGEHHNVTLRAMCELAHLHQMAGDRATCMEIAREVIITGLQSPVGKSVVSALMRQGPSIILAETGGGDLKDLSEFIFEAGVALTKDALEPEEIRDLMDQGLDIIRERWTPAQDDSARRFIRWFYEPFMSNPFWSNAIPSVVTVFAEGQMLDGDLDTAEPILREAVRAGRMHFGDSTLPVAWSLEDLALVVAQRDPTEAEKLMREVLTIRRRTQGDRHPQVVVTLQRLVVLLMQQHKFAQAEPLLRECLDIRRHALSGEPWLAALAESLLGECLTALGRYTEAEELLLNSYSLLRARWGAQHERTLEALRRIIGLYEVSGQPEKAAHYRALRGSEE